MKIKHQLSIATLVMAGVFATGCSQQSVMGEGGSQVAGGQQVSGGSQVAGGQQAAGGSQVAGGQQAAGGSQVAGGQQAAGGQQVAGDTQVAGGQQAAGGQQVAGGQQAGADQQVKDAQGMDSQIPDTVVPMTPAKPMQPVMQKPMQKPKQVMRPKPRPRSAGNCHGHAKSKMTKVVRHCHKNPTGKHGHKGKKMVRKAPPKARVVTKTVYKSVPKIIYKDRVIYKPVYKTKTVFKTKPVYKTVVKTKTVYVPAKKAAPRRVVRKPVNRWCHSHPANSMTKSVSHCHKYNQRNHSHMYGGKAKPQRRPVMQRPVAVPRVPVMKPKAPTVDVFALQQKLKAKGYYRGPIDGVVGSGTRSALQQFMQNRN